jgi:hypothetical protein
MNQNTPTGICCKNIFRGYTPGPPHKGDKGREGIQHKQQGMDKKDVKGNDTEWKATEREGRESQGQAKDAGEGKGLGEA